MASRIQTFVTISAVVAITGALLLVAGVLSNRGTYNPARVTAGLAAKEEMITELNRQESWIQDRRIKVDFGQEGIIFFDGVDHRVSSVDAMSDAVIKTSWRDWQDMATGRLDVTMALMKGKIRVEGDPSAVTLLQRALSALRR